MRKSENSVIPCSMEIDLNGIPTVGYLMEINWTSETRKLRGIALVSCDIKWQMW